MTNKLFGLAVVVLFILATALDAATHPVTSADELTELFESKKPVAGDVIVWADGTYVDQEMELNGVSGEPDRPITIRAATAGGVVLRGESQLRTNAKWLVIEGFCFEGTPDRPSAYNAIQLRGSGDLGAEHVRLTNCAFTSLDNRENTAKWVQIYGRFNQVDHCRFTGKPNKGALMTVELDGLGPDQTAEHVIEWNYFSDVSRNEGSDNETIRIGFSGDQNKPAKCMVRKNLFERCSGESEVISNKSSHNTYDGNTFRACNGSLVLRHGHHATVRNNYFFGDGADDSGGIRINDSHHVIFNNYMQDLSGQTWNAALSIEGGSQKSAGTGSGYQVVEDITVVHNTLINCSKSVFLNRTHGKRGPKGVFANNLIYVAKERDLPLFDVQLPMDGIQWNGNLCFGTKIGTDDISGATELKLELKDDLWRPIEEQEIQTTESFPFVKTDIEGRSRQSMPSIGAIEMSPSNIDLNKPLDKSMVGPSF